MPTEKDIMQSIFGDRYIAEQQSPGTESTEYKKIKKIVLKSKVNKSSQLLKEALEKEKRIDLCLVRNDISEILKKLLPEKMISFYTIRKKKKTLFVIREEDKELFKRAVQDIIFNMSNASCVYDYETFCDLLSKHNRTALFLTELSELQMEGIRKALLKVGKGFFKYSFFRMSDDRFGIAFLEEDVLETDGKSSNCVLKALLENALLFTGHYNIEEKNLIKQEIAANRMSASNFEYSLKHTGTVYVYNPKDMGSVLKIEKEQKVNSTRVTKCGWKRSGNSISIKEEKTGAFLLDDEKGKDRFQLLLSKMNYHQIVYSLPDLLKNAKDFSENKEQIEKQQEVAESKEKLASYIYDHFSSYNKEADWFTDEAQLDIAVDNFKKEVFATMEAVSEGRVPEGYTDTEAKELFRLVDESKFHPEDAKEIIEDIAKIGMICGVALKEKFQEIDFSRPVRRSAEVAREAVR